MCLLALAGITAGTATAAPVGVGTGVNLAQIYIEWSDGFFAEFDLYFGESPLDTVTGADLLLTLDSELADFTLDYTDWGTPENPNLFVDAIQYLDHFDGGYGGGANWWHYWIKDAGQVDWTAAGFGMSDRIVHNGDMDGWVYGRDTIPEPTSAALLAVGGLLFRRLRSWCGRL
jgi:hypothetical protein